MLWGTQHERRRHFLPAVHAVVACTLKISINDLRGAGGLFWEIFFTTALQISLLQFQVPSIEMLKSANSSDHVSSATNISQACMHALTCSPLATCNRHRRTRYGGPQPTTKHSTRTHKNRSLKVHGTAPAAMNRVRDRPEFHTADHPTFKAASTASHYTTFAALAAQASSNVDASRR